MTNHQHPSNETTKQSSQIQQDSGKQGETKNKGETEVKTSCFARHWYVWANWLVGGGSHAVGDFLWGVAR